MLNGLNVERTKFRSLFICLPSLFGEFQLVNFASLSINKICDRIHLSWIMLQSIQWLNPKQISKQIIKYKCKNKIKWFYSASIQYSMKSKWDGIINSERKYKMNPRLFYEFSLIKFLAVVVGRKCKAVYGICYKAKKTNKKKCIFGCSSLVIVQLVSFYIRLQSRSQSLWSEIFAVGIMSSKMDFYL